MSEPDSTWVDRLPPSLRSLGGNVGVRNILTAAACILAGWAAHKINAGLFDKPIVWPPFGVALGAVLVGGRSLSPGVFLGILVEELVVGFSGLAALNKAVSGTSGVLVAHFLLQRFGKFETTLQRVADVLRLLYFGAIIGALVSAGVEVGISLLTRHPIVGDGWISLAMQWMSNSAAVLTTTPLILTWKLHTWRPRSQRHLQEALCLLALLLIASFLVFGETYSSHLGGYSVSYVVFIFSIWSALRFGPRGGAATVFLVAAFSLRGTTGGVGPLAVDLLEDVVLLWSVYNAVFAVCTLILAAVIAERRRGEEALQESELRYHHLFSHAPISIWEEDFSSLRRWMEDLRAGGVTNLKDYLDAHPQEVERALELVRVTDVNDMTVKMFDAENREQILGTLARTLKGGTMAAFTQEILAIWEGKTRYENEVTAHTFKGRQIDYLLHWDATMRTGDTDWKHVIVAIMDITDRTRLREDFLQAQKMDAVGRLAGGIAHDFNNLIMTIQGYSSLLLADAPPTGSPREEAEQIKRAAGRAAALTSQLLTFSRKQVVKPRVLDLNTVVAEMNKMLTRLIGEHIHFETRLAANLGRIKADPGQIEQVIVNLAVNARDAMPNGGRLTIETRAAEVDQFGVATHTGQLRPGNYIVLKVADTGCGMTDEVKAHLFEPFFTTKGAGRGTGLGLSTVYGIVKQCGGEIIVFSAPGQGAAIQIYFQQVADGVDEAAPQRRWVKLPGGGGEVLLVAEDETLVRELLCKCLRSHGYQVLDAACGTDALELASKAERIDMLITDIVMPNMNGDELARRLLRLRPELKVLFHSGYAEGSLLQDNLWRGRAAFMEKPFSTNALLLKVRDMLDGTTIFRAGEDD